MEKLVPRLRFPGFEGEWERKKLGDIANVSSGGTPSRKEPQYWDGSIPWISTSEINFNIITKAEEYITDTGLNNSSAKIFPKGTILIALYGQGKTRGKVAMLGIPASTNQACGAIQPNVSIIDATYFYHNLGSRYDEIRTMSNQGGQQNLSGEIVKSIEILVPVKTEQVKIASFITKLDEKLTFLQKKKTLLEQYKKGMMQKIFARELRFKDDDGKGLGEWEEKTLGDIATKQSSNISANKIEENEGEYIIYGASGILKKVDFYKEENDYISIVKDGAGVGRLFYCEGYSSVLGTMDIIKPHEGINTYFLYCLLSNIDFKQYISGSTIPHIYFKNYSSEIVGIPSLSEQTKIANFLSAIDKKITLVAQQTDGMEVWKKGVLGEVFV